MELIGLAVLAGASMATDLLMEQPNSENITANLPAKAYVGRYVRDFQDGGIPYCMTHSFNQAEAQIGVSFTPLSYPDQTPTSSFFDTATNAAERWATYESQAPKYHFENLGTLGISYGAPDKNNGYNIGVPLEGVSFQGDPGYSLANLGKVFVDRYRYPELPDYTGWHNMRAGEPTANLRAELPNDADVAISARNPYGPHGHYQKIFQNQLYDAAEKRGNLKPSVLGPPRWKSNNPLITRERTRRYGKQLPQIPGSSQLY